MKSANNIKVFVDDSGYWAWVTAEAELPFGGKLALTWLTDKTIGVYVNDCPVSTIEQAPFRVPTLFRLARIKRRLASAARRELATIERNAQVCCELLETSPQLITCEAIHA